MLAYETDDTTLVNANVDEYLFCATRVLPYSLEFSQYGYTQINTRCNDLGNQYTATERKIFYVQKDHLGSTIALTDSSGSLVQSYAYDVYGTPYVKAGSGFTQMKNFVWNLHGNDRLFIGREYDRDINLYYYRARFYSPELGRFISRDPIGMSDDVNLYAYVKNSPMMGVDPSGLFVKRGWNSTKDVWSEIIKGWVQGDFIKDPNGWNTVGQIGAWFIPIYGQISDVRDTGAAWNNCSGWWGCAGAIGLAWVGFIPLVWDGLKDSFRLARETKGATNFFGLLGKNSEDVAKTADLITTHPVTKSNSQMQSLTNYIKDNGVPESIKYVDFKWGKYVVDWNHRVRVANKLWISEVNVERVNLPYAGYETPKDLFY